MTPACLRCGRPTDDGYVCTAETAKATSQLAEIADMVPAARDVAHGLSSRLSGSGGSGKPGSRLPLDLGATARLDAVANALGGWVRIVAEERGAHPERVPAGFDTIGPAVRFLGQHLEWMRHRAEVDEFLVDVEACARVVRGIARGPAAQKYLGPCGATTDTPPGGLPSTTYVGTCEGDVYVRGEGSVGRCRTCGGEVGRGEREAWLDAEVRSQAFRASQIAEAYGINVKTVRSWAERGQLAQHGTDREGRPLYLVGDVLDLAAKAAAQRAENEAKRARRADERLSA